MAVFKCKMCGGTIEFNPGDTVGVCDSCGTKQTLPRLDDDKRANLYDRAGHFRRNNEFDKAAGIYEQILSEDNTDAEAYWSLVLCRYGIEYVEDPQTHKRIPTVNRAQYTSIFDDEDYKSAIANADAAQREVYETEAKTINEIQKGILAISQKEEPFDVFICYKETDENGRRTPDSVLANDLYHQLTGEGFKVFFARITLEDKLGSAYEPYIFAALNSAKVMVVLGTKPAYFNAVWVKNEWSRYLALIKGGAKKILIPAYKDMDPYDLPEEFSHLQAQDMSKLGFMQDLIRGIKKLTGSDAPKAATVVTGANVSIAPLLKRAFMFLEDGNWQEADAYCEKVLDQDPECAEAYLYKALAVFHVAKVEDLESIDALMDDVNIKKAIRFGDAKLVDTLNNASNTVQYNKACGRLAQAHTEEDYLSVAKEFQSLSGFRDADSRAEQCLSEADVCRKESDYARGMNAMSLGTAFGYATALRLFQSVSGWKDADAQGQICQEKIEAMREVDRAYNTAVGRVAAANRVAAEKAAKTRRKIIAFSILTVSACIALSVLLVTAIIPRIRYNSAMAMMNDGRIVEAYEGFAALNDYKDSAEKAADIFEQAKRERIKSAEVGDTVIFGSYEQDNKSENGKENIEWLVLAKEDSKMLLISDKALDCKPYHTLYTDITWAGCSLRQWLNITFLSTAFNATEKAMILNVNVSADKNPAYSINPGNAVTNKVFLLSIDEVNRYFDSDEARKCVPTAYAIANGAETSNTYTKDGAAACWWWLRSPGMYQYGAVVVRIDGSFNYEGYYVDCYDVGVRPALWIDISDLHDS